MEKKTPAQVHQELEIPGRRVSSASMYSQVQIDIPLVTWYKDPGLRKLYLMMPILLLGSTINGYDGSLLNGLQTMGPWQDCKSSHYHPYCSLLKRQKILITLLDLGWAFSLPFRTLVVSVHCSSVSPGCTSQDFVPTDSLV